MAKLLETFTGSTPAHAGAAGARRRARGGHSGGMKGFLLPADTGGSSPMLAFRSTPYNTSIRRPKTGHRPLLWLQERLCASMSGPSAPPFRRHAVRHCLAHTYTITLTFLMDSRRPFRDARNDGGAESGPTVGRVSDERNHAAERNCGNSTSRLLERCAPGQLGGVACGSVTQATTAGGCICHVGTRYAEGGS